MINRALARFNEYFSFEFPYLGLAIIALSVAALWKESAAAALGVVILVIVHSKESLILAIVEKFAPVKPRPADDQKIKAVVESLNKAHANHQVLDEKIGKVAEHVGKLNLRFAVKPLEDAGVI